MSLMVETEHMTWLLWNELLLSSETVVLLSSKTQSYVNEMEGVINSNLGLFASLKHLLSTAHQKWPNIQSGAAYHSLGFEDEDLGSSPGWWDATVATYCPSRPGELPRFLSSKPWE